MLIDQHNTTPGRSDAEAAARLRDVVELVAVPRDILAQPDQNRRVREFIADELSSLGFTVHLQGSHKNVVALPRGCRTGEVVAAHYDSVPWSPGADDNASAVAVLLEAARSAPETTFIAFNAEERNLSGSREFVEEHVRRPRFRVERVHVLEMVGFTAETQSLPPLGPLLRLVGEVERGDFIGLVSKTPQMLRDIVAHADERLPVVTARALPGASLLVPDILRSDHTPFWRAGIPATMWTDTADFRNPHYHQASDTPDTLDYEFMANVAALLRAALR